MRHEVEKRIREYDEDVVVLSQDEAERFTDLLKDIMEYSRVNSKFQWYKDYDQPQLANVTVTFTATVYKDKDISPETLNGMRLSILVNGSYAANDAVKICKC